MPDNVKKIDFLKDKSFTANGQKYSVHDSIPIGMFSEFEKLQIEIGYGLSFERMYQMDKDIWEMLNKGRFADASVKHWNKMQGIANAVEKRQHPMLVMCTLFITREGENRVRFDLDLANEKIKDWEEEALDMQGFFHLAFNFVRGFIPAYHEIFQNTSKQAKEKKSTSRSEK